jgi:threonine dehydrogenase-like Zn-dependent dehydrogenase
LFSQVAFPRQYGYSSVGRILEGPSELVGRATFCLYPHQDYYVVPAEAVTPLPDNLPPERAILAANMETALNAVWDAELKAGDQVSVIGAGVVGALVAYLAARYPNTSVELIDINPDRRALADQLGVSFASPERALKGSDVVIHASSSQQGLATALGLAAVEARIVELSWYGDREITVPLGEDFHVSRLKIISSQVGRIPASQSRIRKTCLLKFLTRPP